MNFWRSFVPVMKSGSNYTDLLLTAGFGGVIATTATTTITITPWG